MPSTLVDPRHRQPIPTGAGVARVLRAVFSNQRREVIQSLKRNQPVSLLHWTEPMVELLTPLLLPMWIDGAQRALRRVEQQRQRGYRTPKAKSLFSFAYSAFMRLVTGACRVATMLFCEETNRTATREINEAKAALREGLAEGLSLGEAGQSLTARTRELFDDPMRAHRIAGTEASRATHAGMVSLAQETGVAKGSRWLASSDACDLCQSLNGKVVAFGEPFHVDPKGGPYSQWLHPPGHPSCHCSITIELD